MTRPAVLGLSATALPSAIADFRKALELKPGLQTAAAALKQLGAAP
jgi:hypothetical protein